MKTVNQIRTEIDNFINKSNEIAGYDLIKHAKRQAAKKRLERYKIRRGLK